MSYFNTNIDNDIMYLLREIGHNCKINNVVAKAIINNASMERTFDDKKIITHEELRRGLYVNYNDLWFLVLNEVNDKRYLSYYKGIIRRCNFDIKFIIANKLYQFPSIIEGDKFFIQDNNIMPLSADTIMVTLPLTQVTKQLKKQDAFIKWGQKWEIQGIDYTKEGLVVLTCKAITTNTTTDDVENEIANRYEQEVGGVKTDKLNGNITPILPFDNVEEPTNPPEEPGEPTDPPIQNTTYSYTYIPPYEGDPDNEIFWGDIMTYTIHKFVDGVEVEGNFTFTLTNTTVAKLVNITNNSTGVQAIEMKRGNTTLIVTDVDTGEIAIEKEITIIGM